MAYFPNGFSFAAWQEEHCSECLNFRDNGTGSHGCAITDAHFVLGYHEGTNAAALNMLIPEDDPDLHKCQMRLTMEDYQAAQDRARAERDRIQYALAMAETRAARAAA